MKNLSFDYVYNKIRPNEAMLYSLKTRDRCLDHWNAIDRIRSLDGDFIEVGVWRGGTAAIVASQIKNLQLSGNFYICDTWNGIQSNQVNTFDLYRGNEHNDASIEDVVEIFNELDINSSSIIACCGVFPESIQDVHISGRFKYVSLDVDIYNATKESFEFLWPMVVSGGIVIVDDYEWPMTPGIGKFIDELESSNIFSEFNIEKSAQYHYIITKK